MKTAHPKCIVTKQAGRTTSTPEFIETTKAGRTTGSRVYCDNKRRLDYGASGTNRDKTSMFDYEQRNVSRQPKLERLWAANFMSTTQAGRTTVKPECIATIQAGRTKAQPECIATHKQVGHCASGMLSDVTDR